MGDLVDLNGKPPTPVDVDETAGAFDDQADIDTTPRAVEPGAEAWRERVLMKSVWVASRKEFIKLPMGCATNVALYLRYHPEWRGVLAYDELRERIVTLSVPPRHPLLDVAESRQPGDWSDVDAEATRAWLSLLPFPEGFQPAREAIDAGAIQVAHLNRVNPVTSYLNGIEWDQTARLPAMLSDYFGVAPSRYACEVGKRWMISAVARALNPGCQVDCVLILEGKTGAGKTAGLRALMPDLEWYSETPITLGDKSGLESLRGKWIYVLDELDSVHRSAHTRTLNFITTREDNYRPPYGRTILRFPRRCVFAGTTEREQWMLEEHGRRRWWPVRVVGLVDRDAIDRDRDQIWAEAVARYRDGEPWYADTPELRALCEAEQQDRIVDEVAHDAIGDPIAAYLKRNGATYTTVAELLEHALSLPKSQWDRSTQMRAAGALRRLGWTQRRRGTERRWAAPGHGLSPFPGDDLDDLTPHLP